MKPGRKTFICILVVIIALLVLSWFRPRHVNRAYNAVSRRLATATGISLPPLRFPRALPAPIVTIPTALGSLPQPFPAVLTSLHQKRPQMGTDGLMHNLDPNAGVPPQDGLYIYGLCRSVRPRRTLEVGFAEGFSTLYFLAAAKANGIGFHVAIDPAETSIWHGIGICKVQEVGMGDHFRFIEALSITALPLVAREGSKFDVIFIDGDHKYDSTLADFVLSDALCPKGGYILFHDVYYLASTKKVVSFIERNRADYKRQQASYNIAAFQKIDDDRREWRHFVDF